ncbi:MAG: hypothetical protein QF654_13715 [Alphaproteobacteria bacterium]|nr:hypothetical protein [Alphaproteobacteria bacterium]
MGYVRLYADDHGESHFEDMEIEFEDVDLAPPAAPDRASAPTDAARFLFVTGPPGWISERHPAPGASSTSASGVRSRSPRATERRGASSRASRS